MNQFAKLMELVLKPSGSAPIYNCMLAVKDGKRNLNFLGATGTMAESSAPISPHCRFRTGSITKPFTATIILQLAEENVLSLGGLFFSQLEETTRKQLRNLHSFGAADLSAEMTVLQLLRHQTGLRDYFADDERFLAFVTQHPTQNWNWELVLEKYFEYDLHQKALFKPGEGYYYADTNYLLLAVMIEQVTGKPLHQVFEERIFIPLGLKDTYLEFFQLPEKPAETAFPYYGNFSLENINTSFDWGGGGLVSDMKDLDFFIRSLVSGALFKKEETLQEMLTFCNDDPIANTGKRVTQYGLGIQKKSYPNHSFIGHNSAYASMMYYDSLHDLSIILSLNQAAAVHKAEWLMNKIVHDCTD